MPTVVICSYLIVFLIWFCLLWFDSWWQLPFAAVMVAGLLVSIYFAVRSMRREISWKERFISLLPLGIVVLSIVLLFLPLTDWKVGVDHRLFSSQRMKFIDEIQVHNPPLSGAVKLPHWWLSEDGEAYVFNAEPEQLLVGFWVRRGMLSPSWIVVYTVQDTPPTAEELHCDKVEVFSRLSPNWYYLWFD